MMKRMFHFLMIGLISSILASCFFNKANLREGIIYFRAHNYRPAFVRLMPEAQKGQPDAQYAIGYMYYYGQGVVEDREKAWFWIRQAAKVGQPEAVRAIKILDEGDPMAMP